MSRLVVHKESLPAQVGIKRRRAPAAAPTASSPTSSAVEGENGDVKPPPPPATEGVCDNTVDSSRRETVETNTGEADRAHPVGAVPEDEEEVEESSDDEDMAELERERRRIEQLRQEKQRAKDEKIGGTAASASAAPPHATGPGNHAPKTSGSSSGGVSSYNHDVLFRRREWREQNLVTTTDGAKRNKKAKWEAVQNNAQHSAAFRHFMKSHFR
ncbi:uncharacterized protein Tco025E_08604 [Trypanosoma conorhini]|uniref:Uncharacterized protein n=1 Tax=Trypanosoma conorhini TaxID=83891 RepID=A0A3R7LQ81_9TRYP|nr:uncharacterized protein Tco025E_08604 [Trypanosoma conorhini]RNF01309.1 hypothetical protein Tco025E_08604 [Trypanosoma conorhini]